MLAPSPVADTAEPQTKPDLSEDETPRRLRRAQEVLVASGLGQCALDMASCCPRVAAVPGKARQTSEGLDAHGLGAANAAGYERSGRSG